MRLEIHQGSTGIENIEHEWNQLFNNLSSPKFSQSVIWHKAYLNYLVPDVKRCYYFCVYKDDNLIAIFPLENIRRKFYLLSFNVLSFSDHSHFGLNPILVDECENTQYLFEFLFQTLKKEKSIVWDLIYLNRVIQNSQAALCKIRNSNLTAQSTSWDCLVLPLQSYDKTFEKLSRNFKQNLRKNRNKISAMDNVEYKSSHTMETLNTYFEHFLDIEASGWKGSLGKGSAIKLNKNLRSFYQEVMQGFSNNGQMEINILMINKKTVASQYVIILEPTVFSLKIAYDEDYGRLGLGNLHLEQ